MANGKISLAAGSISVTDALQYALEDEATKVIAIFMETIREPERFVQMARGAFERGKPIVALKAGRSEVTARVALTHTGALTGDDHVIDALFRQLGIVRVNSVEELILTANAFAHVGQLLGRRLGIVAISGGACDLAADLASYTESLDSDPARLAEAAGIPTHRYERRTPR